MYNVKKNIINFKNNKEFVNLEIYQFTGRGATIIMKMKRGIINTRKKQLAAIAKL